MIREVLKKFMEQNAGLYLNSYAVEFSSGYEDSITVACSWPGETEQEEYCLELLYEAQTFQQFIDTFKITNLNDIHTIQPQHLLDLFNNQQACVNCMINDSKSFSLAFKRCGAHVEATADPGGEVHKVPSDLNGPGAYRQYTVTYFAGAYN